MNKKILFPLIINNKLVRYFISLFYLPIVKPGSLQRAFGACMESSAVAIVKDSSMVAVTESIF